MTEQTKIPDGYFERADGSLVRADQLKPQETLADEMVRILIAKAEALSADLAGLKAESMSEMQALRALLMDEYGVKVGGAEGNVSFKTVDGRLLVRLQISKHVSFGPELEAAKELIDECLTDWSDDAGAEIKEIIQDVFRLNAKGRIDTQGILNLRKHRFEDPRWENAMTAIADAIRRDSSTTYVRFYRVDPKTGTETRIPLEIAEV